MRSKGKSITFYLCFSVHSFSQDFLLLRVTIYSGFPKKVKPWLMLSVVINRDLFTLKSVPIGTIS